MKRAPISAPIAAATAAAAADGPASATAVCPAGAPVLADPQDDAAPLPHPYGATAARAGS